MLVYQRVHPPVLLKPATDLVRTGALAWNNSSQDPSIRTPKTTLFCWETMVNFHGERRFSHQTHGEIKSQHWNQALTEDLGRFFEKRLVCELFWGYHFWDDMALPTVWNLCRRVSASVHFCGSRSHPTREQRASNRAWPGWPRDQIQWNHPSDLYTWYIYIILYIYFYIIDHKLSEVSKRTISAMFPTNVSMGHFFSRSSRWFMGESQRNDE